MRGFKRAAAMMQALLIMTVAVLNTMPISAFAAETAMQTITAELFTDETYSQPLETEAEITLTGEMPEEAVVCGYPVSYDIEGMTTIAAYDITIFEKDRETVFEPDGQSINVTFSLPGLAGTGSEDISVYHISGDGTETEMTGVNTEGEKISFDADSFSVYVISQHENDTPREVPRVEFHFLSDSFTDTSSGGTASYSAGPYWFRNKAENSSQSMQSSQILLDGESLEMIEDPPNHLEEKEYFYGWYIVDGTPEGEGSVSYQWAVDPEMISFEEPISISADSDLTQITWSIDGVTYTTPADADGCAHVYLAPIYSDYYFINFYNMEKDEDPEDETTLSLITCKLVAFGSDNLAESRIGYITAPSPDLKHKVFVGWKRNVHGTTETYVTLDTAGNEIDNTTGKAGYYIDCALDEVDEHNNINLYPVFAEARWIIFHHDPGSTYVGSKYILTNDEGAGTSFTSFPTSSMVGYEFLGWFTAPEGGTQITDSTGALINSLPLTDEKYQIINGELTALRYSDITGNSDITLYPQWRENNTTTLTVNIWKQKSTDEADLPDSAKTYDFASSDEVTVITGSDLSQLLASSTLSPYYITGDNNKFKGFHYGHSRLCLPDENNTVDGYKDIDDVTNDGQTVLNLYYDRNVYELYFRDYEYTPTTSNNGTQYGLVNGTYVMIYYKNRKWRTSDNNYGPEYNGTRYTRSTNITKTVKTIRALYEHNISNQFPIHGDNGIVYDNGERWKESTGTIYKEVLVWMINMPDSNITFNINTADYDTKTMNYYVECLDSEPADKVEDGKRFRLYNQINAKYGYITQKEDFLDIEGYQQYKSDPAFDNNGEALRGTGGTTIDMYYTIKENDIIFDPNYPTTDAALSFNGISYLNDPAGCAPYMKTSADVAKVKYSDLLSSFDSGGENYVDYSPWSPDNYVFAGWYEDSACTKPYQFTSPDPDNPVKMPAGNVIVYAKWEKVQFRIKMDPNGAEIDHINHTVSDYRTLIYGSKPIPADSSPIPPFRPGTGSSTAESTYYNASYQEPISLYTLKIPEYIAVTDETAENFSPDEVYYYMNMQYEPSIDKTGIPSDLRNALYMTDMELENYYYNFYVPVMNAYKDANPAKYGNLQIVSFGVWKQNYVSPSKYVNIAEITTGRYVFQDWFEVMEDGSLSEMPFVDKTPAEKEHTLKAIWKLDGGFTIAYIPSTLADNGTPVNGRMEQWQDPALAYTNYADQAETTILRQPDEILVNDEPTIDYIFRSWQLVGNKGTAEEPDFYPLEPGVYHQPGEKFDIQAKYADKNNIIHFRAVYEHVTGSYRRPDTAALKLDANGGYLTEQDSETRLTQDITMEWKQWYDSDSNGYISSKLSGTSPETEYDQLWFSPSQPNAALHLYQFAAGQNYETTDSSKPSGGQYFAHEGNYMLLGFDRISNEGDYIADYAADAVISIQRNDNDTLYAVWEPTVYLNFENDTSKAVTFSLTAEDTQTLYVVNKATSIFDRVKLTDLNNITIPAGETLRLAIPYGKDKNITINGTNALGVGKVLKTSSYLPGQTEPHLEPVYTDNGQTFTYSEQLVEDHSGVKILFEEEQREYVLILSDPEGTGRNTGDHEFDYSYDEISAADTRYFTLDETRSSTGYIFAGWSNTPGASEPDYVVNDDITQELDLLEIFSDSYVETDNQNQTKVRRLYAVWKINNEAGKFYVYKEAPLPGAPDQEFTFTVDLDAPYTYRNRSGTVSDSDEFTLKNGEYLLIERDIETGTGGTPHIWLKVTRYNARGRVLEGPFTMGQVINTNNTITVTNQNYRVTVTENSYPNYNTTLDILAQTDSQGFKAIKDNDRQFHWTDPNTGGTTLFTNTRKTADVTLKKKLIDPEIIDPDRRFSFTVELVDEEKDYSYTLSESESQISLHSNDEYTLHDLPVNALLRITETGTQNYDVSAASANGSSDLNSDDRIYEFRIPQSGETVTFTNELRKVKVELYSVDENGDPFRDAAYMVPGDQDPHYPYPDGSFYSKDPMYLGSFTVTQTWCDDAYEQITSPITFTISGTDDPDTNDGMAVTADNANYRAEYDSAAKTWKIYIINHEKQIAPTGVGSVPAGALALTALFSLMFCTAFVYINRRRREVD